MTRILVVVKRDVIGYFKNYYEVGFRTAYLVFQVLVFAYILAEIVPQGSIGGLTYLQYFALGSTVISLFGASYTVGRDIHRDWESGFLQYLLTLPISRKDIVIGRGLGGAIRSTLNMIVLYGIALILVPTTFLSVITCIALLFIFSFGLCSLGILLATGIRQEITWRLTTTVLDLVLIRSSTAMYPAAAMPIWLQVGTRLNPLTYAADSVRNITSGSISEASAVNISVILLFAVFMGIGGAVLYSKKVEGGAVE